MDNLIEDQVKLAEKNGHILLSDDGARIEYLAQKHKESFKDPEEKVRVLYYIDLVEKYNYPKNRIELEVEMPDRTPERYADIVIFEDNERRKPYIVVECKKDGISDAEFEQATKQAIANARVLNAPYAICVAGNTHRAVWF
jgi:type I restriction enzyme M protein